MRNALVGAVLAVTLSLGIFVLTLVYGADLFIPRTEIESTVPEPTAYFGPTPVAISPPSPIVSTTIYEAPTATSSPASAARTRPATATLPPTPTIGVSTPTIPAPVQPPPTVTATVSTSLPDLAVLWLYPTYAWIDDNNARATVSVGVFNQGAAPAVGFWVTVHIDDQPSDLLHRASMRWFVDQLPPGKQVTLESQAIEGVTEILLRPGNYVITAVANSGEDRDPIAESDTSDNTLGPLPLDVR